ncbi:unnamed protein product [Effrenium voratum]|uniref:Secreted protein n=1 Tax=Effrenium voratum TaxID=2562239 RepID=A0AA36NMJ6_9DINO|nr:unnamed protein product [Effrenium voratum]
MIRCLVLLGFAFCDAWAVNATYKSYSGTGCSSGEREFECAVQQDVLCCQHASQTLGWYCQGTVLNRKDFPAGQDCSGQHSQEIIGFLNLAGDLSRVAAGECIDYGDAMSVRFTDVTSAAIPCGGFTSTARATSLGIAAMLTMSLTLQRVLSGI